MFSVKVTLVVFVFFIWREDFGSRLYQFLIMAYMKVRPAYSRQSYLPLSVEIVGN